MQLPANEAVVMVSGTPPVKAAKLRYYEDGNFQSRVMSPPLLTSASYSDRPPARPDDWSGAVIVASDSDARVSIRAEHVGERGADEGGLQIKPILDPVFDQSLDSVLDPVAVTPQDDLLLADDADDRLLRPQDVGRQLTRTARLAALDADDGIAL